MTSSQGLTRFNGPPAQPKPSSSVSFDDAGPKTPVCIGQLRSTALVLHPVHDVQTSQSGEPEWIKARLHHERNVERLGCQDTINIRTPSFKSANGSISPGKQFGVVEQEVASALGPLLIRALIRLDAKVRKGTLGVSRMQSDED